MIHLLFDRPTGRLKVYDALGVLWLTFVAGGDAWGNYGISDDDTPPSPPYGHACWCPPGHYRLDLVQYFDPPIASEGFGQIPVLDLDVDTLALLQNSGRATVSGTTADIGGITLPFGQLAKQGRSAIMIHCGGSNAPDPFADDQGLYRTFGCTRMLNEDWKTLAAWLVPQYQDNTIIYSIVGDPLPLAA